MRIRVNFERPFETSYIGHLDLKTAIDRGLRRTLLPLKYTEGFNKRVKLEMGFPLNVGMVGEDEYFDFYLNEDANLEVVNSKLENAFAGIIKIKKAKEIPENTPSITAFDAILVNFIYAELTEDYPQSAIEETIKWILDSEVIIVSREGKKRDIRKFIERVELFKKENLDLEILLSVFFTLHGSMRVDELEALFKEHNIPINFKFAVRKRTSLLYKGKIISPLDF
jgi:radical SAM-linked protein